jgi:hypothetical protein
MAQTGSGVDIARKEEDRKTECKMGGRNLTCSVREREREEREKC